MSKFTVSTPASTCLACEKRAYDLEKIIINGQTYHKACFRCAQCNRTLGLGNYAAIHGRTYCKPHFTQLFKSKGNYEEGFGEKQHKDLWKGQAKDSDPTAADNGIVIEDSRQIEEEIRSSKENGACQRDYSARDTGSQPQNNREQLRTKPTSPLFNVPPVNIELYEKSASTENLFVPFGREGALGGTKRAHSPLSGDETSNANDAPDSKQEQNGVVIKHGSTRMLLAQFEAKRGGADGSPTLLSNKPLHDQLPRRSNPDIFRSTAASYQQQRKPSSQLAAIARGAPSGTQLAPGPVHLSKSADDLLSSGSRPERPHQLSTRGLLSFWETTSSSYSQESKTTELAVDVAQSNKKQGVGFKAKERKLLPGSGFSKPQHIITPERQLTPKRDVAAPLEEAEKDSGVEENVVKDFKDKEKVDKEMFAANVPVVGKIPVPVIGKTEKRSASSAQSRKNDTLSSSPDKGSAKRVGAKEDGMQERLDSGIGEPALSPPDEVVKNKRVQELQSSAGRPKMKSHHQRKEMSKSNATTSKGTGREVREGASRPGHSSQPTAVFPIPSSTTDGKAKASEKAHLGNRDRSKSLYDSGKDGMKQDTSPSVECIRVRSFSDAASPFASEETKKRLANFPASMAVIEVKEVSPTLGDSTEGADTDSDSIDSPFLRNLSLMSNGQIAIADAATEDDADLYKGEDSLTELANAQLLHSGEVRLVDELDFNIDTIADENTSKGVALNHDEVQPNKDGGRVTRESKEVPVKVYDNDSWVNIIIPNAPESGLEVSDSVLSIKSKPPKREMNGLPERRQSTKESRELQVVPKLEAKESNLECAEIVFKEATLKERPPRRAGGRSAKESSASQVPMAAETMPQLPQFSECVPISFENIFTAYEQADSDVSSDVSELVHAYSPLSCDTDALSSQEKLSTPDSVSFTFPRSFLK